MPALTESEKADAIGTLQDLIRIDSTNQSRDESNERRAEEAIIAHVVELCADIGMETTLHEVWPGRRNLTARWPDQQGEHSVGFEAHVDTVGVGGMAIDPFSADLRDGKVWGRGACDAKGSLATFISALKCARARGLQCADKICLIATIGEETGCDGATALMESGFRVDACVVGEPTRCQVVSAHKGALWFKLIAHGTPSHGAMPDNGRNAIYTIGRAVGFIENEYRLKLARHAHRLLGSPTISVGTISGGQAVNIVPSRCEVSIDCRYVPDQDHEAVVRDFLDKLRAALPADADDLEVVDVEGYPAMEADPNSPFVRNLLAGCRTLTGQTEPTGVYFFADSGPFHRAGIQCVLFGPGDIAHAHKAEEFIEVDQYTLAIETVLSWLAAHQKRSLLA